MRGPGCLPERSRRSRRERGQAMLIGVVALMVLAIGMYTTYNLSRSVYEKIRLQNTADATAYSLATLEARTFNFIAFANRAQIANYVMMMEAQSILSNATYLEGIFGYGGDLLQAVGNAMKQFAWVPGLGWMEAAGEALVVAGKALEVQHDAAKAVIDRWEQAGVTQKYLVYKTWKNKALFAVSTMLALATIAQLADGGRQIVSLNDPRARFTWLTWTLNALNSVSYAAAFDPASFGMFASDDEVRDAKRLITETANASRFGSVGDPDFIVARDPSSLLTAALAGDPFAALDTARNQNWRGRQGLKNTVDRVFSFILGPNFVGTTKMITAEDGSLPALGDTRATAADRSGLPVGDAIVAKDMSRFWALLVNKRFASVRSTKDESEHCRYEKPQNYGSAGFLGSRAIILGVNPSKFECKDHNEDNHRWSGGGIQPYVGFRPEVSGVSAEDKSFNQPDVWVWLNKPPGDMTLDDDVRDLQFEIRQRGRTASMDARIGENALLFEGLNVISRAQVYYHRPGAWREPPNFFNPYWGARLAPTNTPFKRLLSELGLGGGIAQIAADNILMH